MCNFEHAENFVEQLFVEVVVVMIMMMIMMMMMMMTKTTTTMTTSKSIARQPSSFLWWITDSQNFIHNTRLGTLYQGFHK